MAKKSGRLLVIPDHIRKAMESREREEFEIRTVPLGWQLFAERYIAHHRLGGNVWSQSEASDVMTDCLELGYLWTQLSEAWMDRRRKEKDGPSEDLKKIKVD